MTNTTKRMENNDQGAQTQETATDKTVENDTKDLETLDAQRKHWKEQAIDPETGKKWKDLAAELKSQSQSKKSDKTDTNDTKSTSSESDDFGLSVKAYLRAVGVTDKDEVELARDLQKKTGMDWEDLVDDDYFQNKLESLRDEKANAEATSDLKAGKGGSDAKLSADYWIKKGVPPTPDDVPNRKDRAKIARAMLENQATGKTFYNE